jgi:hypothetical protein
MGTLQSMRARAISPEVIMGRLFALFVAFSLLLGPLAMDRAMAAVPASSHSQMSDDPKAMAGHCQSNDQDKTQKAPSKPCCAAMCATAAVLPESTAGVQLFNRLPAVPAPASAHRGVLSEIATPPPRVA